jgi:hypothetical protein
VSSLVNGFEVRRFLRRWVVVAVAGLSATTVIGAMPPAVAGTVLYDNTGNPLNTFYAAQGGAEALDDLHLVSAGRVDSLVFEYFDPAVGGTLTATASIYDNPGGFDLGGPLLAGPFVAASLPRGRKAVAIALPVGLNVGADLWVGIRFSSTTAGVVLHDVPSIGSSHDLYLENGGFYWFGGDPRANFGIRLAGTSAAVAVGDGPAPLRVELAPALPNPFHDEATLRFTIERAGPVRLDVYDVSGRHVRALVNEVREAGPHTARWSGRDDEGRPARAGVYFVRLASAGGVAIQKVLFTP